jgi:hypothetical protein
MRSRESAKTDAACAFPPALALRSMNTRVWSVGGAGGAEVFSSDPHPVPINSRARASANENPVRWSERDKGVKE